MKQAETNDIEIGAERTLDFRIILAGEHIKRNAYVSL